MCSVEISMLLYVDKGGGVKPCTAESRHWQNHIKYMLATNASLILCKEASVVTISSDVK